MQVALVFLPLFFFSISTELHDSTDQIETQLPESSAVIYMTSGAVMVGSENIHQVEIIQVDEVIKRKIEQPKKHISSIDIIATPSLEKIQKVKKKEVKVDKKKLNIYTYQTENSDVNQKLRNSFRAFIFPVNLAQKLLARELYFNKIVEITSQLKKQKFYTSHSYLQFRKYSSSSLRGPPRNI